MKIFRILTLLIMLLLSLGAWADVVNVNAASDFATSTQHNNANCYRLADGNTYKLQNNNVMMGGHIHIPSGATVTIDLNNFTLSRDLTGATGWGIVIYNDGGNLTITDSSNEKGGILTGGYNSGHGSGIYNKSGTLTIEGGTFTCNHAGNSGKGGAIYIETGTLNLKGGIITNNIADGQGGGIYVESNQTMNMLGAPTITGNMVGSSTNNLFLGSNVVINVGDGGLTGSDGTIGVTKDSPGLITTALDNDTRYKVFVSDKNNYETANSTENKAYYQTCWMGLANKMNAGGEITLNAAKVYEAYSTDPCLTVPSGKTVNLDLNGLTLNRGKSSAETDGCAIKVENSGTLTISGSGTIKGGKNSSGGGGIQNLGTLTISGGTIRENTSTSWGGGIHNEGTLNISGGIIEQNTASGCNGGGIHNTGTLNITGGTIRNNSATLGAGIYHDGATFSLQGAPDISGNASKNVYLTAAHPTITINGDLGNSTAIGITMETLGVFTSGLSTHGSINNFSSEADNSVALVANNGEAELITCWNYLKRQLAADGVSSITLASGTYSSTGTSDDYLHVPSDKTVVLNLNGQTLNRNLSSATNDGCVIYNQGTLTINGSGTIRGGHNSDLTSIKGGGICNTGTLTITGGTISNNTTAQYGGGIYNIGDLRIQGGTNNSNTSSGDAAANGVYHNGTSLSIEGAPVVNIYLATTKTLTIPSPLTNSSADHIKIACADEHLVFTPGVNTSAYKDKFSSNQTSKGIGFNSSGYAMIGTKYTITRSNVSAQASAIRDERVAVTVSASSGYIPITLNYTDEAQNVISLSSYPENSATYYFDMPAKNISVTATCYQGGYCGAGDEKKIKYYLQDGTLKFITDGTNCAMANYAASAVPWRGLTYSAIDLSSNVTSISDYAFAKVDNYGKFVANTSLATVNIPSNITSIGTKAFFNCTALAAIYVDPANPNYSAANGVLFNKDGTTLICYPAGKQENEANNYTYTMSNSVTSVAEGAFAFNTHLKGIAVTSGGSSFKGVDGVLYNAAETSLICYPAGKEGDSYTVASSVTSIGAYAFQSCSALRNLYVLRSSGEGITTGGACMLDGTHSSLKILVKSGSVDAYKEAPNWSAYSGKIFAMDLSNSITITLDSSNPDDFDYEGVAITPDITVKDIVGTVLTEGVDYTVAYSNNNAVGTGHITVKGKGNYAGETTMDFYITRKVSFNSTKDYATYYSNEDLEIMSGGKAYIITEVNWTTGDITKVQVNYIKAQTPVILYKSGIGNAGNNPYYLKAYTGTSAYTGLYENFLGKLSATSYNDLKTSGISDIYILRGSSFVRVSASGELPANRCYLARPSSAAASRGINSLSLEGGGNDATSLSEVKDEEVNNNEWYTLDGRRLQEKPTKKGVYISKGKKIVVH